jgi:hypothetical protein
VVTLGAPLPPRTVKQVAKTLKAHWQGLLNAFDSKFANGRVEAANSLIQAAKARGYGTTRLPSGMSLPASSSTCRPPPSNAARVHRPTAWILKRQTLGPHHT